MNPLLKRQIRKYFPEDLAEDEKFKNFFRAIEETYTNNEEQLRMIQHATKLSSDELFSANRKLQLEADNQKKILDSLHAAIKALQLKNSPLEENNELNVTKLAKFIEEQSKEIQLSNQKQKDLLVRLENKNQALSDYAHVVSHDLKSPLRSINSLVSWIKEDYVSVLDENGQEQLRLIQQLLEKMDGLISGILNYSTIDQAELQKYPVDLQDLVEDIIKLLYTPEHINIKIAGKLPIIFGDKFRLQQLFQNIIQNAIKSIDKPNGEIKINAKELKNNYKFSISDNGKGVKKEHFLKIFRIFEKIDNDPLSTGIGLSIVKRIVDFYDGKIWLESELSKGTTFYFTLPK
ncbi:sensor histidine kinase [Zunongwangia sp.]|uniref:sensor histidine kinase n=1 Tax=Zunongwangia sp. TaxID=1965325 RepID=UPI003AA96AE0